MHFFKKKVLTYSVIVLYYNYKEMRNKDRAYRVGEDGGDQVLGSVTALAKLTEIPIKSVVPTTRQFLLKDIVAVTLNFSTTKAMENDQGCANEQGRAENCILVAFGEGRDLLLFSFKNFLKKVLTR